MAVSASRVSFLVRALITLDVAVALDPLCVQGHGLTDSMEKAPKFLRKEDVVLRDF